MRDLEGMSSEDQRDLILAASRGQSESNMINYGIMNLIVDALKKKPEDYLFDYLEHMLQSMWEEELVMTECHAEIGGEQ